MNPNKLPVDMKRTDVVEAVGVGTAVESCEVPRALFEVHARVMRSRPITAFSVVQMRNKQLVLWSANP